MVQTLALRRCSRGYQLLQLGTYFNLRQVGLLCRPYISCTIMFHIAGHRIHSDTCKLYFELPLA